MTATSGGPTFRVERSPDFENLRRTLLRQRPRGPVPFIELFADPGTIQTLLGEELTWLSIIEGEVRDRESTRRREWRGRPALDAILRFCYENGYDYVYAGTGLSFTRENFLVGADVAGVGNFPGGVRVWQDERTGPIQSWADFEAYPWPEPDRIPYSALEYLNEVVPEGMKISVNLSGIFENSSWLMGLESFSYALADQPELVEAICQRVGELTAAAAAHAVTIDNVGMVFLGDDLGFATGTLISPDVLRQHIFPHYRRLVEIVHAADRLMLLHSCGNLERIMDDLIDVGFDAKHSFEDKIMPVEEVYERWGDRIAVLGGVDMDLLARGSEEEVRKRTRQILETCAARGTGYCLGTGNSVANYLRPENYLTMLDEGRRWNREHFSRPAS
jgi:uroporphyrinogen decarboxylase